MENQHLHTKGLYHIIYTLYESTIVGDCVTDQNKIIIDNITFTGFL